MARGLFNQPQDGADKYYDKKITLFRRKGRLTKDLGIDLRVLDIQRDRDHGLRHYIDYRILYGLPEASNWDDLLDSISSEA
ncbi:peroxidase-like [Belonocnema kinseyi]|uniref:peroxidase-like n=1 Tax=Belonocnema kinseyi TaxID=2817044 RepID=UPI00143CD260|nr:peroxidase-like [Belonocnema kinseyi]